MNEKKFRNWKFLVHLLEIQVEGLISNKPKTYKYPKRNDEE